MSHAEEVVAYLAQVQGRFEALCQFYNAGTRLEEKSWDSPLGPIRTMISRGDVFEKASCIYCDLEIDTPPVLAQKMGWQGARMRGLVLEIGIHPVNPHIPKGYIELRANSVDTLVLAGGTDIFPYIPNPADAALFADSMRETCSRHGLDYGSLQKTRADFFTSRYSTEHVGSHAGIYFFHLEENRIAFFKDMAEAFFVTYEKLVKSRKGEGFTHHDRELMQKLHGQWAQWILLEDEGTRFGLEKGIPPEALLGAILPPIARF